MELLLTKRLRLRRLRAADLPALVSYRSLPEVARFQGWTPDWSLSDAEALLQADQSLEVGSRGSWIQIALEPRTGGSICGDVALHPLASQPDTFEVGITLSPEHQGQGIASEAPHGTITWLFESWGAHRVIAHADARNVAVRRLLEGLGLRLEGEFREGDWFKNEWTTLCTYAVLKPEWPTAT